MRLPSHRRAELLRMQEARRQVQRQLDLIDRQINRRMTALMPKLRSRESSYRRGKDRDGSAFLERYRSHLAALTAKRQPEIDARPESSRDRILRSPVSSSGMAVVSMVARRENQPVCREGR